MFLRFRADDGIDTATRTRNEWESAHAHLVNYGDGDGSSGLVSPVWDIRFVPVELDAACEEAM